MTPAQKRIGADAARRSRGYLGVDCVLSAAESELLAQAIENAKEMSRQAHGTQIHWKDYVDQCRSQLQH